MIGWKSVLVYGLSLGLCLPPLTLHAAEPALRAGRDLNRIENPSGPAVIQTDKGTVIINNTTNIVQGIEPEKYAELAAARPYYARALAVREKVLGPEHPDTAQSLNNLGTLLHAQGELAAARRYLERALAVWENKLVLCHVETLG